MAREVNETQSYFDKAVKLIPTEIVGAYMVLAGVIGIDNSPTAPPVDSLSRILIQVVFFALLVMTPLYLWKISNVTNKVQLIVTSLAFVLWIYNLGGPFTVWGLYNAKVAAVLLTLWSLVVPVFVRPDPGTLSRD